MSGSGGGGADIIVAISGIILTFLLGLGSTGDVRLDDLEFDLKFSFR